MVSSDALTTIPLLAHLAPDQRVRVAEAGHGRRIGKGDVLFHAGESSEAMYAVLAGRIKLVKTSPAGKELLLHLVNAGETFAEAAMFGDATYPATAVALEDCRLWCLPRARLLELVRASPDLGIAMLASISRWTRRLATKLEQLTQRRVEERLAAFLLGLAARRPVEAGDVIRMADPRNLIAAQIGTAPEVLSRALRRLEEEGIATFEAHSARIEDPGRLQTLASSTVAGFGR